MKTVVKKPWGSFEVLEEGKKYTLKKIASYCFVGSEVK